VLNRDEIRIGNVVFDIATRSLCDVRGADIELRNKSSEVLAYLARHRDRIAKKDEIIKAVWPNVTVTDESLTQCIADIRRAIGDKNQTLLKTHIGKGYALNAQARTDFTSPKTVLITALVVLVAAAILTFVFWPHAPAQERPRIAVLAFDDLSAGEDRGWLSDGIAEGVITELAKFPELTVIARNSSFKFRDGGTGIEEIATALRANYIVEGSKQKSGDRLRVTVQFINAHDGSHIWAHEYNTGIAELFDVQSEIVRSITVTIGMEVAWRRPPPSDQHKVTALHYYLSGNREFQKRTAESSAKARDLYMEAIDADPEAPFGYVGMVTHYWRDLRTDWVEPDVPRQERIAQAVTYAETALRLDPDYYAAHIARGDIHLLVGENQDAVRRYQMALDLNPSSGIAMVAAADPLVYLDRAEEAVDMVKRAIDINPMTPMWYYSTLGHAQWAAGHCDDGIESIKMMDFLPAWSLRNLIALQVCVGDLPAARQSAVKLLEQKPDFTVGAHSARTINTFNNPQLHNRWLDALRMAGLPEN